MLVQSAGVAVAALALSLLGGCTAIQLPGRTSRAETAQQNLAAKQGELQRFADEFMTRTAAALDEYARRIGTPDARSQALTWKLPVVSAAVGIASGPSPSASLLDLITLGAVTRLAVEDLHAAAADPAPLVPWLEVSRSLEAEAWELAVGVLDAGQREELRAAIQRWWSAAPDARSAFFGRPAELGKIVREAALGTGRATSVFGLVGLDPTAGLDPAVREVTRTRLFAERALFTSQRMPFLLRWQVELLADRTLRQSDVARAVTNVAQLTESAERLSRAAESASQTAATLPDRVSAERAAILAALEEQEGRLRELSAEVGRTLAAGERMSGSFNTTIGTFDALMRRFGIGEPDRSAPGQAAGPPFNILDYARTAEQLTLMAQELNTLLHSTEEGLDSPALDRRLKELDATMARTKADAKAVLNHAFLLAAGLVLLAFACALAYRRLAPRAAG
ncbi:MAG: hypothetical protein ACKVYV_05785 [Limisphaerales bacterium]